MRIFPRMTMAGLWILGAWLILVALKFVGLRSWVIHLLPIYHRGILWCFGIRLRYHGDLCKNPVLYCANHASWLDILVLGTRLKASFVAKQELLAWPLLHFIFRIQDTIFVNRRSKQSLVETQNAMMNCLETGRSVILFPEGTTGDGNRVIPLSSALFGIFEKQTSKPVWQAQAITISYSGVNNAAAGRLLRPHFSWQGEESLIDHVTRLVSHGHSVVDVVFHKPVHLSRGESRKDMASHVHEQIESGLVDCHYPRDAEGALA